MKRIRLIDMGLFILAFKVFLDNSRVFVRPEWLDNLLTILILSILMTVIIQKKYRFKTLLKYLLIGGIGFFSAYRSGESILLITIIVCMAIRDEDLDYIVDEIYMWQICFLVIHTAVAIVLSVGGFFSLGSFYSVDRYRVDLGFSHANILSMYIFNLILLHIWKKFNKITNQLIIVYILITLVTFILTDSRTTFAISICIEAILLFYKNVGYTKKIMREMAKWCMIVLAVFTIGTSYLYISGNKMSLIINKVLNNRILLGAYQIFKNGPSLLGARLPQVIPVEDRVTWGLTVVRFDCIYTSLFVNYGIVWLLVLIVCFYFIAQKGNVREHIMIICFALYGVTEVHALNCMRLFPIMLITYMWNNRFSVVDRRKSQ